MSSLAHKFRTVALGVCTFVAGSIFSCNAPAVGATLTRHMTSTIVDDPAAEVNEAWLDNFQDAEERQEDFLHTKINKQVYSTWMAQLDNMKDSSLLQQTRAVSRHVNSRVVYERDSIQYGKNEYWASGIETIFHGKGDCEDFAIAEFDELTYLGAPKDRYCLILVAAEEETKAQEGEVDHAILAIDTSAVNNWSGCVFFGQSYTDGRLLTSSGYKPVYYVTPTDIGRIRTVPIASAGVASHKLKPIKPSL